jgi:hypothetical protein
VRRTLVLGRTCPCIITCDIIKSDGFHRGRLTRGMHVRSCSPSLCTSRVWGVWISVILFTSLCFAENTHSHLKSGPSEQHCSLCIAAHSVARPAQIVSASAAPARCVAVVSFSGQSAPELDSIHAIYIRPPPAV